MDVPLKAKLASAGYRPDPVTTEIVRNGLIAATEEMKTNLMRTAYNMIIYEALDFTVGLFDAEGDTLSIGLGLPMFIRGMSDTVKTKLQHYGVENLDPGDILLTNDAYITGSHLNHMTFTVPIFHDGEVVAFSCCMAHWPDVGGTLDGATTDIFSEGLQMPIVKIYRRGVPNEELISIIRTNVRLPDRAMGDFRAQVAAVKTGERRFLEMIQKYGRDAVLGGIEAIMDHSEAATRARVREIPDGVYEAESFMDDDGIRLGERVPIRVRVEIAGERMKVDLTDVAKQVAGFYNSGETAGRSCCQVAFKCLTSPLDLPINDGQFRALEIVLPPGRVVSALKPAAMRMWMTYPMTIIDTIFKALAPAISERIIAGHHADLVVGRVNGRRPQDDSFYIYLGGLIGGGWGAKRSEDGVGSTVAINDGDTHNGPNEQAEAKFPIVIERYALVPDSGGAGRRRVDGIRAGREHRAVIGLGRVLADIAAAQVMREALEVTLERRAETTTAAGAQDIGVARVQDLVERLAVVEALLLGLAEARNRDAVAQTREPAFEPPRLALHPVHLRVEADVMPRLHHLLAAEPAAEAAGPTRVRT